MEIPELQSFHLVGGTALALKYGHRTSIDLDLFCVDQFEHQPITDSLQHSFGKAFVYEGNFTKWGIFCQISGVKVDIVHYPNPILYPVEVWDKIRMYDDRDLIAMKIQAILGRGKKKDFWDLYELLQHYELPDMIEFHKAKFPSQMLLISIPQAIIYFDDADKSDEPVSLKGQTWTEVKEELKKKVREFLM
jgi:predicted nucleotidyltransferase component of viral defense system